MQTTLPSATTFTAIIECVNGHKTVVLLKPPSPGPEQERGNRCRAARYSQHPPPKTNTQHIHFSVADPGSLSRIEFFPSRIPDQRI